MRIINSILLYLYQKKAYGSYERHLSRKLKRYPGNPDLAYAQAIGADTVELFAEQGDLQVKILRLHGLKDGMVIFDLGCGCGRTAQALQRSGWVGSYLGSDVVKRFTQELMRKCPGYRAITHRSTSIPVANATVDLLFHWSVFTHISPEECFIYLKDIYRSLKPGGKLIFSFMELNNPEHFERLLNRTRAIERGEHLNLLDSFLHRDWIVIWAYHIGFADVVFTSGHDGSKHPAFWQSLVAMTKPMVDD